MSKFFFLLLFSFSINLSAQQVSSEAFQEMLDTLLMHSVHEMEVKMAPMPGTPGVIYLDAREKKEFDISHIESAKWVGYNDFDIARVEKLPKNSKVIVYCSVGYRSEKVSEQLIMAGFKDVHNLYGGIFEWVNEGNPVYKNGKPTTKVHAFDQNWGSWCKKGKKVY